MLVVLLKVGVGGAEFRVGGWWGTRRLVGSVWLVPKDGGWWGTGGFRVGVLVGLPKVDVGGVAVGGWWGVRRLIGSVWLVPKGGGWLGTGGVRVGVFIGLLKVGVGGVEFEVGGWWGVCRLVGSVWLVPKDGWLVATRSRVGASLSSFYQGTSEHSDSIHFKLKGNPL